MVSSAGQSPHHGFQDDIWGAEGGSSYREETPMPFDLEADFPEPEVQRQVEDHRRRRFLQGQGGAGVARA